MESDVSHVSNGDLISPPMCVLLCAFLGGVCRMRAAEELGADRFSGHRGGGFGHDRQVQSQPPVSLPPAPRRQQQGAALLLALGCRLLVLTVVSLLQYTYDTVSIDTSGVDTSVGVINSARTTILLIG